jgi:hypothetical protein
MIAPVPQPPGYGVFRAAAAALCAALLLLGSAPGCAPNPVTAGGTDMPNERSASIRGRILDSAGEPLAGAAVSLFAALALQQADAEAVARTRTNTAGRYAFDSLAAGSYRVLALSADSTRVALSEALDISASDTATVEPVVRMAAAVRGAAAVAIPPGKTPVVSILHTPYAVPLAPDGGFAFYHLPADTHIAVLALHDTTGRPVVVARDTVVVTHGTTAVVDTLRLMSIARADTVVLVDDFEDGDRWNNLSRDWWSYTDGTVNPAPAHPSAIVRDTVVAGGAGNSGYAAHIAYSLDSLRGWSFVGYGTWLSPFTGKEYAVSVDVTGLDSVALWLKGSPQHIRLNIYSPVSDLHFVVADSLEPGPEWTRYVFPVDQAVAITRGPPGMPWSEARRFAGYLALHCTANTSSGSTPRELWIDNVELIFGTGAR